MSLENLSSERASEIRQAVKSRYRQVAVQPGGYFHYPIGRESAHILGYDPSWIQAVPVELVERFVGVGNPFSIRKPRPGERVLDAGCGCGMDSFIAALLVGETGHVSGVDLTTEMLAPPQAAVDRLGQQHLEFRVASIEALPYEDRSFDLAISNGVLNMIPDKKSAFSELARILKPDGTLVAPDLLVMEDIPEEVLASKDAWSA